MIGDSRCSLQKISVAIKSLDLEHLAADGSENPQYLLRTHLRILCVLSYDPLGVHPMKEIEILVYYQWSPFPKKQSTKSHPKTQEHFFVKSRDEKRTKSENFFLRLSDLTKFQSKHVNSLVHETLLGHPGYRSSRLGPTVPGQKDLCSFGSEHST